SGSSTVTPEAAETWLTDDGAKVIEKDVWNKTVIGKNIPDGADGIARLIVQGLDSVVDHRVDVLRHRYLSYDSIFIKIIEKVCEKGDLDKTIAVIDLVTSDNCRKQLSFYAAKHMANRRDLIERAADLVLKTEPQFWQVNREMNLFYISLEMMRYPELKDRALKILRQSAEVLLRENNNPLIKYLPQWVEDTMRGKDAANNSREIREEVINTINSLIDKGLVAGFISLSISPVRNLPGLHNKAEKTVQAAVTVADIKKPEKETLTPLEKFYRRIEKAARKAETEPPFQVISIAKIASKMAKAGFVDEAHEVFRRAVEMVKKNAKKIEEENGDSLDWLNIDDDEFLAENNPWRLIYEIAVEMGKHKKLRQEAVSLAESIEDNEFREDALEDILHERENRVYKLVALLEDVKAPLENALSAEELVGCLLKLEKSDNKQEVFFARMASNPNLAITDGFRKKVIETAVTSIKSGKAGSDYDISKKAEALSEVAYEAAKLGKLKDSADELFKEATALTDSIGDGYTKSYTLMKIAGNMAGHSDFIEMSMDVFGKALTIGKRGGWMHEATMAKQVARHRGLIDRIPELKIMINDLSIYGLFMANLVDEMAHRKDLIELALGLVKQTLYSSVRLCHIAQEMAKYKDMRSRAVKIVNSMNDPRCKIWFLSSLGGILADENASSAEAKQIFDELMGIVDSGYYDAKYVLSFAAPVFIRFKELRKRVMDKVNTLSSSLSSEMLRDMAISLAKYPDSVDEAVTLADDISEGSSKSQAYYRIASHIAGYEGMQVRARELFGKAIRLLKDESEDNAIEDLCEIAKAMASYPYLVNKAFELPFLMKSGDNRKEVLSNIVSTITDRTEDRLGTDSEYAREMTDALLNRFSPKGHPAFAFNNMPSDKFTIKQYMEATGVPQTTARRDFNVLKKMGVVNIEKGKGNKPDKIASQTSSSLRSGIAEALKTYRDKRDIGNLKICLSNKFYDTEFATILLSDLAYAWLHEDRIYEVKYDTSRLSASQIDIVEEYIKLLKSRSSDPDNIRSRPFSSTQGSSESLIAVYCSGKDFKGEGHVDVSIQEGELRGYLLRITGMINIALASSNVPDNLSKEDVDKYRPILSYISNQYRVILGEGLAIPDSPEDILKVIRRIVLGLPKVVHTNFEQIEEYNRLAKEALVTA
ncbi:MAG: hypothetical protein WC419_03865, partial [Candidatus Omnitrophota bacterium]